MPSKPLDEYSWDEILEHLEDPEGGNGQWQAWCPCHDDVGTSRKGLSLTEKKGKKYAKCWSCGATLPDVIDAIEGGEYSNGNGSVHVTRTKKTNVSTAGNGGMAWWVNKTGVAQDVWESLGCVERGSGVVFTFEGHDAVKVRTRQGIKWEGTKEGEAPPLWPAVEDELPEKIDITEGESDCGTLRAAGFTAYALTKGAKGALPPGAFEALKSRGVREVTLHPDADDAGAAFASR